MSSSRPPYIGVTLSRATSPHAALASIPTRQAICIRKIATTLRATHWRTSTRCAKPVALSILKVPSFQVCKIASRVDPQRVPLANRIHSDHEVLVFDRLACPIASVPSAKVVHELIDLLLV